MNFVGSNLFLTYLASVVVITGCSGDPRDPGVLATDSAGVTLVQHRGGIWIDDAQWEAATTPFLEIGSAEGVEAYLFNRISGIADVQDSLIVVANGGSNTLRWYDATGRFLFERGGSGQGPGEFTRLGAISVSRGDTLVSTDWGQRRVTLYTASGQMIASHDLREFNSVPGAAYRAGDGSFITGATGYSPSSLGIPTWELGIHRPPSPIVRVAPEGDRVDTIGVFPGLDLHFRSDAGLLSFSPAPFAKQLHYTVHQDEIYVGTAEQFRIDRYSLTGQLQLSVRAPDVDLRLSPEDISRYETWIAEEIRTLPESERAAQESYLAGRIYPAIRPAFSSLIIDRDGNVWVGEFLPTPYVGEVRRWIVFDREGLIVARIAFPASFQPLSVVDGTVLGRAEDDLGVEYVHGYQISLDSG